MSKIFFLFFSLLYVFSALADIQLPLIRRVAVFPIADSQSSTSEDAWWQMRELLTKDQKFLVASRRFMINRGVFQPRKSLLPADAIILAKILDAQALVTTWVDQRTMKMNIYEGGNGYLLWETEVQFHPAISINDQLLKTSLRMMTDFILALPYQGYQIVDPLIGKSVYEKNAKKFAQVFIGNNSGIQVGEPVQWIQANGDISQSFLKSSKITIIAEGIVTQVLDQKVEVEILKLKELSDLEENSLIRFPKEFNRLRDMYVTKEKGASLSSEYLSSEIRDVSEVSKETHPTTTALAFIINIAGVLLLAF